LQPDSITPAKRHSRKAQLLAAFGEIGLPVIDVLVGSKDKDLPFLRSVLRPGSWYWIGVRSRVPRDRRLSVYVGSPELGADRVSSGALQFLESVPPYFEYRLRDIFSLAHILDAGEEEGFGGEGAPPPDGPLKREPARMIPFPGADESQTEAEAG
jgi:hypothetical protein